MGDPRRARKKFSRPSHPWKIERITNEKELSAKYGLKNRKEIWKAISAVGHIRSQARALLASSGEYVEKEKKQLLDKLNRIGILDSRSIDDILALTVDNMLERRLQTIVYKKGLTRTIDQARQLIVHGHVLVGEGVVNVPGYTVPKDEEDKIRIIESISEKLKVINVGEGGNKGKEVVEKA